MKNSILLPLTFMVVGASLIFLTACSTKKSSDKKSSQANVTVFPEPDIYFNNAIAAFESNDIPKVLEQIALAKKFTASVLINNDTLHASVIEFAIADLEELQQRIKEGKSYSSNQMRIVFSGVDQSIGTYHIYVVEAWIANEEYSEKVLNRVNRAIVRTENAIKFSDMSLTEDEEQELALAKKDLAKAEKITHSNWSLIKAKLMKINQMLEENENDLDGTL